MWDFFQCIFFPSIHWSSSLYPNMHLTSKGCVSQNTPGHWGCLPGGCLPREMSTWGYLPKGCVYPRRCLPGWVSAWGMGSAQGGCLPQGYLPKRGVYPRRYLPGWVSARGGGSAWGVGRYVEECRHDLLLHSLSNLTDLFQDFVFLLRELSCGFSLCPATQGGGTDISKRS